MTTPVTILAYAYYSRYLKGFSHLLAALLSALPQARLVLVSTLPPSELDAAMRHLKVSSISMLGHDNTHWEFGAWQRGLDSVRGTWRPGEALIVLNDTCARHSVLTAGMRRRFIAKVIEAAGTHVPRLVGELDAGKRGSTYRALDATRWVRSCLFGLNSGALAALDWCLDPLEADADVLGHAEQGLTFSEHVSVELASHVNVWLSPADPAKAWYRAADQTADAGILMKKAVSILKERRLAAQTRAAQGELIDIAPVGALEKLQYRLLRKRNSLRRQWCERFVCRP